ncbi:MAG: type II secretion system protein [Campylobacterota bacterium]
MKRAGFTMIELIFVIVILGILAAVALPKFAGVSDQANAQKCNAFVGTLNRTVGPSMWSASIANNLGGGIETFTFGATTLFNDVQTYIELQDIPLECLSTGTVVPPAPFTFIGAPVMPFVVGNGVQISSPTFGTSNYSFDHNSSGDLSASATWTWRKLP